MHKKVLLVNCEGFPNILTGAPNGYTLSKGFEKSAPDAGFQIRRIVMEKKQVKTDCLGMQARRADRILTQIYDAFIKPTGLKSTQYGLLRCINNFTEPCIADISAAMCMDQTTVSRNIGKLQGGGFITTSASAADPRKTIIKITSLGYQKMDEAQVAWEKAQLSVKEKLGEDIFEQLYMLLGKIPEILGYKAWSSIAELKINAFYDWTNYYNPCNNRRQTGELAQKRKPLANIAYFQATYAVTFTWYDEIALQGYLTVIASLDYLTRMEEITGKELKDIYTRMIGTQQ